MIHWLWLLPFAALGSVVGWMAKDLYEERHHHANCGCRCWQHTQGGNDG